jgi:hypothetical protein
MLCAEPSERHMSPEQNSSLSTTWAGKAERRRSRPFVPYYKLMGKTRGLGCNSIVKYMHAQNLDLQHPIFFNVLGFNFSLVQLLTHEVKIQNCNSVLLPLSYKPINAQMSRAEQQSVN